MPTLELETTIKIHFDYNKAEKRTQTYPGCPEHIQINLIEIPGCVGFCVPEQKEEEKIEEWIWEARDEWKED